MVRNQPLRHDGLWWDGLPRWLLRRNDLSLWRCRRRCGGWCGGGCGCSLNLPVALLHSPVRLLPLSGLLLAECPSELDFGRGNIRSLQKVHRLVERYWFGMLRSRSWAGQRLTWSEFHQLREKIPLLRPKLRLPYRALQALAVL